jgi:hypothetical protein
VEEDLRNMGIKRCRIKAWIELNGINYKGSQGHTERAVVLQEEEEEFKEIIDCEYVK